ncbi:MAG: hypothetical protein COV76_02570 [Candidatus Omnitrophica bacterium CG11_big_fil_rev_8_21_14_0_20_64_10]|nr:MAG: hypothetical protein COV76_02570 [Candidatus Omnitrophica bacterium CG11_big_fil_rev_8_21_14_0_20_64_10]
MAFRRLLPLIGAALGAWLLGIALMPGLLLILDPFFFLYLTAVFLSPPSRPSWPTGLLFGGLKDLVSGGLFGLSFCAYGIVGCGLGFLQRSLEREDPIALGIWTAVLTVVKGGIAAFLVLLADPEVTRIPAAGWGILLVQAVLHAGGMIWLLPKIARWTALSGRRAVGGGA